MEMEAPPIQWYPGHIAKLERELEQHFKQLDVVIELIDARIPYSSGYPALSEKIRAKKPVLLVMNKADLADPYWTNLWKTWFKTLYPEVLSFDSTTGKGKNTIVDAVLRLGETAMLRQESRGLKRRPIRTGVMGMPNVGKSTLINALVGKKKAKTGHRAGVTRTTQWVRIHPSIELLDTPGMIPPKLESAEQGQLLASVYSVGDAAFDEEAVAPFFLDRAEVLYPGMMNRAFDLPEGADLTLETISKRRHYLLHGGEPDVRRTAQAIFKDFRHGKLGRLTLERPERQHQTQDPHTDIETDRTDSV